MNYSKFLILFASIILLATPVWCTPCGTSGMTVVKADSGLQYILYLYREGPDVAYQVPGKEMTFPNGFTGPRMYNLDGVVFESLFVKTADFMPSTQGKSDLDILKAQQKFEVEYLQKAGGPLKSLVELGPRDRPAAGGQPAFTFYLWQMVDPKDLKGASQYYLTTVSSGEVAVLSAIVPNEAKTDVAMNAFQSYAGSFQHILRKQQCPASAPTPATSPAPGKRSN